MSFGRGGRTSSSHLDSHDSWYKNRGQGNSTLFLADYRTRTLMQSVADVFYFYLPGSFDCSKFSFALNSTIWRIRSKGIGLSNGNISDRLGPS